MEQIQKSEARIANERVDRAFDKMAEIARTVRVQILPTQRAVFSTWQEADTFLQICRDEGFEVRLIPPDPRDSLFRSSWFATPNIEYIKLFEIAEAQIPGFKTNSVSGLGKGIRFDSLRQATSFQELCKQKFVETIVMEPKDHDPDGGWVVFPKPF